MPPPRDEGSSPLHEVHERLYAQDQEAASPYGGLSPREQSKLPHAWASRPFLRLGGAHHMRFATRFFIAAVGFFAIAAGVATFLFFTGTNTVSVDNVSLTIQGPTTVAGGDTVPLSIVIKNKNPSISPVPRRAGRSLSWADSRTVSDGHLVWTARIASIDPALGLIWHFTLERCFCKAFDIPNRHLNRTAFSLGRVSFRNSFGQTAYFKGHGALKRNYTN